MNARGFSACIPSITHNKIYLEQTEFAKKSIVLKNMIMKKIMGKINLGKSLMKINVINFGKNSAWLKFISKEYYS